MSKKKAFQHWKKIDGDIKISMIESRTFVFCPLCGRTRYFFHIPISISLDIEYNWYCTKCKEGFVIATTSPRI